MTHTFSKGLSLLILTWTIAVNAHAAHDTDATSDSTLRQLQEIVVEGANNVVTNGGTTYRTDKNQRRFSQNGFDLLRHMSIPEIIMTPMSNEIKSAAGGNLLMFINGVEASEEDVQNINPADVRSVKLLNFPADARYKGAERALDFIVQPYTYGGFTSLSTSDKIFDGATNRSSIYSTFTYRSMTYQVNAISRNNYLRNFGTPTSETFHLPSGEEYLNQDLDYARFKSNSFPVSLRATHNSKNLIIENTIGYVFSTRPTDILSGRLSSSDAADSDNTFKKSEYRRSNGLHYSGQFIFTLPKAVSLSLTPSFSYSHTNSSRLYSASAIQSIDRYAKEDSYEFVCNVTGNKNWRNNSFGFNLTLINNLNNISYTGQYNYYDHFRFTHVGGGLTYKLKLNKFNLSTDAGMSWEETNIGGTASHSLYPYFHLNASYSINSKNSIGLFLQHASFTAMQSDRTPDILQNNQFLYITGNPHLKNSNIMDGNLSYTWFPSNIFYMSASVYYGHKFDRIVEVYSLMDDGHGVLRSTANNGAVDQVSVYISGALRLLQNKLNLNVTPSWTATHTSGLYGTTVCGMSVSAGVNYYLGNYNIGASYYLSGKSLDPQTNKTTKVNKSYYTLSLGAVWGDWNLKLTGYNFFNYGRLVSTETISTPLYSYRGRFYSPDWRPSVELSVTYTINYGKKVGGWQDLKASDTINSAILE